MRKLTAVAVFTVLGLVAWLAAGTSVELVAKGDKVPIYRVTFLEGFPGVVVSSSKVMVDPGHAHLEPTRWTRAEQMSWCAAENAQKALLRGKSQAQLKREADIHLEGLTEALSFPSRVSLEGEEPKDPRSDTPTGGGDCPFGTPDCGVYWAEWLPGHEEVHPDSPDFCSPVSNNCRTGP